MVRQFMVSFAGMLTAARGSSRQYREVSSLERA